MPRRHADALPVLEDVFDSIFEIAERPDTEQAFVHAQRDLEDVLHEEATSDGSLSDKQIDSIRAAVLHLEEAETPESRSKALELAQSLRSVLWP